MKKNPIDSMEVETLTDLTREQLARMCEGSNSDSPVVTLQLPMERKGAETRKNPIVFKNALAEAQANLQRFGSGDEALRDTLQELEELERAGETFWQHQEAGLSMVIRKDGPVQVYRTPFSLTPLSYVGTKPYLGPLLKLLDAPRYYVLMLDLDQIGLFVATHWLVEEMELNGLPRGLDESMTFDDPEKSLQNRRVSSSNLPGPGGGDVVFHGHGVTGDETRSKRIRRFFEKVDDGLAANLRDREGPLVLLGPDDEIGLYREVNHYPHLCEEHIHFNASNLKRDDLEGMIREWVADRANEGLAEKLGNFREARAQGRGSSDAVEVIKAAADGRVAAIFLMEGEYRYGVNDRETDRVELRDEREPGDEELLGAAAAAVASAGGEVHFVGPDDWNGEDLPAAIFRY